MALAVALLSSVTTAAAQPSVESTHPTLIRTIDPRTGSISNRFALRITSTGRPDSLWTPDSTVFLVGSHEGPIGPIAPDGAGGHYAAWTGLGSIYGDVYLQRIDASGQIAEGWPSGGVPVCRADHSQYNIALTPDGEGGVFVAWQDFRSGEQSDIYLQRITSAGTKAPGWPDNGRRIAESVGDQNSPAIAADGNRGVTVAWQDRRSGQPRIHALTLTGEGEARAGWPPTGACLAQGGTSDGVALATIGHEAVVAWRTRDGSACRIVVRRLSPSSVPDTTELPTVLVEQSGVWISEPAVVADSSGYLVTWTKRSATDGSIETQRLSANGAAPQWPMPANVTSVGAGFLPPNVLGDGAGGALVVWDDFRTPAHAGVFLQHVSANGDSSAGWTADGLNLTAGSSSTYGAIAMPDGAGGLIVSWAASDTTSLKQLLGAGEIPPLRGLRVREAKATPGRARITWQSYEPLSGDLLIERRVLPSNWEKLAAATAADSGFIRCDDQAAPEGSDLEYRVVLRRPSGAVMFAPVRLSIPVAPSILSLNWGRYDAPSGAVELSFSLPRGPQPSVEFLDVAGRRMHRQSLSNLDPGEQRVQFRLPSRMATGMYFMRGAGVLVTDRSEDDDRVIAPPPA